MYIIKNSQALFESMRCGRMGNLELFMELANVAFICVGTTERPICEIPLIEYTTFEISYSIFTHLPILLAEVQPPSPRKLYTLINSGYALYGPSTVVSKALKQCYALQDIFTIFDIYIPDEGILRPDSMSILYNRDKIRCPRQV